MRFGDALCLTVMMVRWEVKSRRDVQLEDFLKTEKT